MADRPDAYKTLQVDPEADVEVIQAAYRRLAQKYHPDTAGEDAAGRMVAINEAWALLRDPASRAEYDRERAARTAQDVSAAGRGRGAAGSAPASHTSPRGATVPRYEPDSVSSDWTSGRSASGGGYDPTTMRAREGLGAAGEPPGNPSGTVLAFGRYAGWSLGEIARRDIEYVEWLERMPIGRPYREEIDALLRGAGRRRSSAADSGPRRGLFRRR